MSDMYVLDAHVLLWFLEGNEKLSEKAKNCVLDESAHLVLPVIALAEILWIIEKQRTSLTLAEIISALDSESRFHIQSLDESVVFAAQKYGSLASIHDRLIAATVDILIAAGNSPSLVTADSEMHSLQNIRIIW